MSRLNLDHFVWLAIALCLSPSLGSAATSIPPAELKSAIEEARVLQKELRTHTGLPAEPDGDHISVTSFGGLPSESSTVALTPGPGGLWVIDQVDRPFNFKTNRLGEAKHRHTVAKRVASDQISRIAASDALYLEPAGVNGGCTDQPIVVIEIVFRSRRRDAVRTACPPQDMTWKLVEAVYDAEPKAGR
jgi:hypothetical protein